MRHTDPYTLYTVVALVFGSIFLIVGAVYLAKEQRQKAAFKPTDCSFVESRLVSAQCPRLQYDGCGCAFVFTDCDEVGADSSKTLCCSGSCREHYYSGGRSRTRYREKQYTISYVECTRVNALFEIGGKNVSYSYVCDEGHRLRTNSEKTEKTCETMYESRTTCYYDGSTIRMGDPYDSGTVIWSSCFIAIGGVILIVLAVLLFARELKKDVPWISKIWHTLFGYRVPAPAPVIEH